MLDRSPGKARGNIQGGQQERSFAIIAGRTTYKECSWFGPKVDKYFEIF